MSGLTLGLLSMDTVELEVLKRSGSSQEQAAAKRIIPVVKVRKAHWGETNAPQAATCSFSFSLVHEAQCEA